MDFMADTARKTANGNKHRRKNINKEKSLLEDTERIAELLGVAISKTDNSYIDNIQNRKETEIVKLKNAEDSVSDPDKEKRSEEETAKKKLFLYLDETRSRVLPHCREIVAEHREEVFHAIKTFLNVVKIANYDGLVSLERETKLLSDSSIQSDQMFAFGLQAIIDDFWTEHIMEKVFRQYQVDSGDIYMDCILYFCIRIVIAIQEGLSCTFVKRLCLSMIPMEEHKAFEEYLKYGLYAINGGNQECIM